MALRAKAVWYHEGGPIFGNGGREYPAGWYLYDANGIKGSTRNTPVDVYFPGSDERITVCEGCGRINGMCRCLAQSVNG